MEPKRKWYQMKRTWLIGGALLLSSVALSNESTPQVQPGFNSSANVIQSIPVKTTPISEDNKTVQSSTTQTPVNNNLSNNNSYINVNGNTVHSPAYSNDGSIPAGASAKCGDGTYSFSQNRRGTCSRHGGVSVWY